MTAVNVYRDGKLWVRAEPCTRCLFTANRLVGGERARQLIAAARATPAGTFVCHRSQVSDDPEAVCAAYFEHYAEEDHVLRLAIGLGIVERVEGTDD